LSSVNLARSVTLSVLLLAATISLAQGVKIVSPGAGAVSSPVRVVADFSSTAPLDSISVFVDNVEMRQLMPVTPLDLSVSMSEGSHLLTVKAVQADGTEISSSRSVNVSPPQTVSSILRSSGSVTYNNIEQMSGWYTYPDQGSPVCSSKPKVVSAPSVDGASGQFYLGPLGDNITIACGRSFWDQAQRSRTSDSMRTIDSAIPAMHRESNSRPTSTLGRTGTSSPYNARITKASSAFGIRLGRVGHPLIFPASARL